MKRKALLTLAVAAVMLAMLALPALAASVSLTAGEVDLSQADRITLRTKGMDEGSDDPDSRALTLEVLAKATKVTVEVGTAPAEDTFDKLDYIWQGNGDGWGWNQAGTDGVVTVDGKKISFDLTKLPNRNKMAAGDADAAKLILAYWDHSWITDLGGVKSITVEYPGGGSDKTGDGTMIALAVAALTLAAGSVAFFVRKVKA